MMLSDCPPVTSTKPLSSLSALLLARKGGAKPAMRSQMLKLTAAPEFSDDQLEDLGWNDMGEDAADQGSVEQANVEASALIARAPSARPAAALASGKARRAAVSLRMDKERRLKLKLAAILCGQSVQQLLSEALDRVLDDFPELTGVKQPPRLD
jgi:hypothetical protein